MPSPQIQELFFFLFQGKQAKIKEMYEQSVLQSEQGKNTKYKLSKKKY